MSSGLIEIPTLSPASNLLVVCIFQINPELSWQINSLNTPLNSIVSISASISHSSRLTKSISYGRITTSTNSPAGIPASEHLNS